MIHRQFITSLQDHYLLMYHYRSLTESTTSITEGAPPSTAPPPQTSSIAPSPIKVTQVTSEQGDSPWDSDR